MQIVQLLLRKEHAVNDLVSRMPIQQSGVSRHLRILEEAGFVQMRAAGTKRLYSLRAERFRELDQWLTQYRQLWNARLDAFGGHFKQNKRRAPKSVAGGKNEQTSGAAYAGAHVSCNAAKRMGAVDHQRRHRVVVGSRGLCRYRAASRSEAGRRTTICDDRGGSATNRIHALRRHARYDGGSPSSPKSCHCTAFLTSTTLILFRGSRPIQLHTSLNFISWKTVRCA